ncbi:hypothetical protein [Propionivibrio dicarboxylicus]|uniref:Uncharacterized protein n=1 Tax=Propionivibrio dicarboxylicus TaxID=83767 RepID=A0A1G8L7P8_9RHOO|nr:hypothetical protein [Propionivibrio dicarboxylicus]SDI51683.1 hypothetical protein SAMN05660652_03565 [Propionivibrio dicarboxylicus]
MRNLVVITSAFVLFGCAAPNTGITEINPNHYMYAKQDWMSWSGATVKVEMFKEAAEFCKAKGKKMEILGQSSQDAAAYTSSAGAEIQFQCI